MKNSKSKPKIKKIHDKKYILEKNMVHITLSIPKELKKEMDLYFVIDWSAVAREAINRKIQVLKKMDKILSKSKLTEEDALYFGEKITKKAAKKFEEV